MARRQPVGRDRLNQKLYGGDPVKLTRYAAGNPLRSEGLRGIITTMVPEPTDRGRLLRRRTIAIRIQETQELIFCRAWSVQHDPEGWAYIDAGL